MCSSNAMCTSKSSYKEYHSKECFPPSSIIVATPIQRQKDTKTINDGCDSWVGPTIQTAIFQVFSLVRQRQSKAYAINCSCFATGAQNTLYIQKKKERTKINHPWPHFLAIPNSPVQFCPFPVYPGWQSHTCDPLVLVQFAFSWQEWFPLHSSMSMKPQM